MSVENINREFEVFMREMMKAKECAHENIENELRRVIRATVNSCATMYGFSVNEALANIDSNGDLLENIPKISKVSPNEEKIRLKELEKAEKIQLKEFEKAEKIRIKEFEKFEKNRRKEFEKNRRKEFEKTEKIRLKESEKTEKANESSERSKMKEQDIASKAIEKLKLKKKKTVTKKVKDSDCESLASTVIMTDSEHEEIHILFQNVKLIEEIDLIRNIKIQKKLSKGVKLARQILDI